MNLYILYLIYLKPLIAKQKLKVAFENQSKKRTFLYINLHTPYYFIYFNNLGYLIFRGFYLCIITDRTNCYKKFTYI